MSLDDAEQDSSDGFVELARSVILLGDVRAYSFLHLFDKLLNIPATYLRVNTLLQIDIELGHRVSGEGGKHLSDRLAQLRASCEA